MSVWWHAISYSVICTCILLATSSNSSSLLDRLRSSQKSHLRFSCHLVDIGLSLENDKITSHGYGHIYCEVLSRFRHSPKKLKMLEIGFGCGHHNHGTSARMWKKYFEGGSGPGLSLFEIEYGPYEPHEKCVGKFLKTYPIGTATFLPVLVSSKGDQSNVTFLKEVLNDTGADFDIIIDDGGHMYNHMLTSFQFLWPALAPGGVYFIEVHIPEPSSSFDTRRFNMTYSWLVPMFGLHKRKFDSLLNAFGF